MSFQRLRGFRDIYGEEALAFAQAERAAREVFTRFGFEEMRVPVLESKELFCRALGNETDVVQKEMYEFEDRSKERVAMRPEGTAGVVRAYLENNIDKNQGLAKYFYMGPMFRSERPQAGRLRQFHQIGVEVLGDGTPQADAETIHCLVSFLDAAGAGGWRLRINNLGTFEERGKFKEELKTYFAPKLSELCEDCKARYERNVFRLLDCKNERCRAVAAGSPPIGRFLTAESREHWDTVRALLSALRIPFEEDRCMVRGLDYYTKTVFEVSHPSLGAQDALGAGGRYDTLVETFGGSKTGAVGFAVGVERLLMCMAAGVRPQDEPCCFVVALGDAAAQRAFGFLADLRRAGVRSGMGFASKSMKSQMRLADRHKSRLVAILGDDEVAKGVIALKDMTTGQQREVPLEGAPAEIKKILSEGK